MAWPTASSRCAPPCGDVQRELRKSEADVEQVSTRAARDRARLEAGTGSAKDLQGLQHELESLARRQSDLEDVELEVMERLETAQTEASGLEDVGGGGRGPRCRARSRRVTPG